MADTKTKANAAGNALVRELPVKMSDDEHRNAAIALGRANTELVALETKKRSVMGGFNKQIADQKVKLAELSEQVTSGHKMAEVEVGEYANYTLGKIELKRADTLETVESRPMTAADRQQRLPLPIAGNPDDAPPADIKVSEAQAAIHEMQRKADKSEPKGNGKAHAEKKPTKKPRPTVVSKSIN